MSSRAPVQSYDVTDEARVHIAALTLHELVRDSFCGLGMKREDASAVADALSYADLRGIDAHGIERAPVYLRRVKAGLAGGTERMVVVAEHGGVRRLDAAHALGPAAATRAMSEAIELAARFGLGLVAIGNSTHIGAVGFYARQAAERGYVALVMTNAPKSMAPHGASEAFLGANSLAIAVPMGDRDPFVLDMSAAATARGKIRRAARAGMPIADGLALDSDGVPTVDARRALSGALLPVGGPKGTGLAFAMTLMLVLLAGADPDDNAASMYTSPHSPQNLGQLFLAIDPSTVADQECGRAALDGLVERLHALHPQVGGGSVQYAGEGSAARARLSTSEGIDVLADDLKAFAAAAEECGLEEQADRVRALLGRERDLSITR